MESILILAAVGALALAGVAVATLMTRTRRPALRLGSELDERDEDLLLAGVAAPESPIDRRAQVIEAHPIEAQPIEARSAEAGAIDAKAVEAQLIEAQLIEAKLIEAPPGEGRATGDGATGGAGAGAARGAAEARR